MIGAEHPDTLFSVASLAWAWKRQHRLENAIPLMSDVVRLSKTVLGVDNSDFKDRQRWLSTWLKSQMKECESSQNAGKRFTKPAPKSKVTSADFVRSHISLGRRDDF